MGSTIGRYELLAPLGRGGMAEVFLARRRGPGGVEKRLVIKRIHPNRVGDARFHDLFVEEARLSMSLAHKNIVSVFDFGRAGDELFLAMEFVDGRDLAHVFERARSLGRPPDPALVAFIAMEICAALDYVQRARDERGRERAIVHRDISPRNLMLSFAGEVKLVDFGIAQVAAGEPGGAVRGTPGYMAPEQMLGAPIDVRADLFSRGLGMWEALSFEPPYGVGTAAEILERAARGDVAPLPPSVPDALTAIIGRATSREPGARFPNAREMEAALDRYLVAERARTGGDPLPIRVAEWLDVLFADRAGAAGDGAVRPIGDQVVTFRDDGARAVAEVSALLRGRTAQSMAETAAAAAAPDEPGRQGEGPAPAPPAALDAAAVAPEDPSATTGRRNGAVASGLVTPRSPRRAIWIAGGMAVAAAVVALASVSAWRDEDEPIGSTAGPLSESLPAEERPASPAVLVAAHRPAPADDDASLAPAAPPALLALAGDPPEREPTRGSSGGGHGAARPSGVRPASGTVRVLSSPWAQVRVLGRADGCPETPCTLELPPGRYTLALENPHQGGKERIKVRVESARTVTVQTTLRELE